MVNEITDVVDQVSDPVKDLGPVILAVGVVVWIIDVVYSISVVIFVHVICFSITIDVVVFVVWFAVTVDVVGLITGYQAQDAFADWNGDGAWNFFDVSGFLEEYLAGCP